MFLITPNDSPRALPFRLESSQECPWARELKRCWRSMMDAASRQEAKT